MIGFGLLAKAYIFGLGIDDVIASFGVGDSFDLYV